MISGAGVIMSGGRGGKIDDHTYDTSINSPNWSPCSSLKLSNHGLSYQPIRGLAQRPSDRRGGVSPSK
jgi:hypothetical protein